MVKPIVGIGIQLYACEANIICIIYYMYFIKYLATISQKSRFLKYIFSGGDLTS